MFYGNGDDEYTKNKNMSLESAWLNASKAILSMRGTEEQIQQSIDDFNRNEENVKYGFRIEEERKEDEGVKQLKTSLTTLENLNRDIMVKLRMNDFFSGNRIVITGNTVDDFMNPNAENKPSDSPLYGPYRITTPDAQNNSMRRIADSASIKGFSSVLGQW